MRVYEELARCFAMEEVTTHFGLMGDGYMHFMVAVRHEHCALLMAVGYWSATGLPGVCSVTHGPGFTQLMTGLTTAARNNAAVVVLAGETGIGTAWSVQTVDQAPLARACGADYLAVHSPKVLHYRIREAFYIARTKNRPVVLGIPIDLMKTECTGLPEYVPSLVHLPPSNPMPPEPSTIGALADRLMTACAPVLVAGRGAVLTGAGEAIEQLADASGALLGTTLLGTGIFDDHPFSIGVVGGCISEAGRDAVADTDLVIAFGAQLSRVTLDGGKLFGDAETVQVDIAPRALNEGLIVADRVVRADAKLAAEALLDAVCGTPNRRTAEIRTKTLATHLREAPADSESFDPPSGFADPCAVFDALERVLPPDYHLVSGAAHQAYWHTSMRGIAGGNYHAVRAYGAIGNSLSFAAGIATAQADGKVILSYGDGGLLMHVQELETLVREGIRLLVICINDGAYGAEVHKLRADAVDAEGAIFGHTDLAALASAFGLGAATITDHAQVRGAFEDFENDERAWLWGVRISGFQQSPPMRAGLAGRGAQL
jgi:acetolactate synthase-1/2/3 large subunit